MTVTVMTEPIKYMANRNLHPIIKPLNPASWYISFIICKYEIYLSLNNYLLVFKTSKGIMIKVLKTATPHPAGIRYLPGIVSLFGMLYILLIFDLV